MRQEEILILGSLGKLKNITFVKCREGSKDISGISNVSFKNFFYHFYYGILPCQKFGQNLTLF